MLFILCTICFTLSAENTSGKLVVITAPLSHSQDLKAWQREVQGEGSVTLELVRLEMANGFYTRGRRKILQTIRNDPLIQAADKNIELQIDAVAATPTEQLAVYFKAIEQSKEKKTDYTTVLKRIEAIIKEAAAEYTKQKGTKVEQYRDSKGRKVEEMLQDNKIVYRMWVPLEDPYAILKEETNTSEISLLQDQLKEKKNTLRTRTIKTKKTKLIPIKTLILSTKRS